MLTSSRIGGGQAPNGRVRLNPRHEPRGLIFACPAFSQGVLGARDLVSGVAGTYSWEGTGSGAFIHEPTTWGRLMRGTTEAIGLKIRWDIGTGEAMSASDWTVACWVLCDDSNANQYQQSIFCVGDDASSRGVSAGLTGTNAYWGEVRAGAQRAIAGGARTQLRWTHLALCATGLASRVLYVNGVEVDQSATSSSDSGTYVFDAVGMLGHSRTGTWNCTKDVFVADAIACRAALSAAEVRALYAADSRWNHYQRAAPTSYFFPLASVFNPLEIPITTRIPGRPAAVFLNDPRGDYQSGAVDRAGRWPKLRKYLA